MGMQRAEWIVAVLVTGASVLGLAAIVLVVRPFDSSEEPGPDHPRRRAPNQVEVWVGEIDDGVLAVLSPVWGDPKPDRSYDGSMNRDLGLEGDAALGYCRLLLFNTSKTAKTLSLDDSLLEIAKEGGPVPLRSLVGMVERGEVTVPDGLAFTLRAVGTLRPAVTIPPGAMANLVVPFAHPAALDSATAVQTAKGSALRARPIPRGRLQAIMQDPSQRDVESLLR